MMVPYPLGWEKKLDFRLDALVAQATTGVATSFFLLKGFFI